MTDKPIYEQLADIGREQEPVAWLRIQEHENRPTTIHLCDSDHPKAFKVYATRPQPASSQAKSLALLDLDSVEYMQGGANGPTIRLRGFINAQTGQTEPQPPIDNAFVAEGCEQFSTPTEPAEPVASYWLIECKNGFTGWYTGKRLDCRFFDTDPRKAYKFASKELAENEISERGHSCMIATEHVDIAAPPAEPPTDAWRMAVDAAMVGHALDRIDAIATPTSGTATPKGGAA